MYDSMAPYDTDYSHGYADHLYYTHLYHAPSLPTHTPRQHHVPCGDPRLHIDEYFDTPEEAEELREFIRTIVRKRKRPPQPHVTKEDLIAFGRDLMKIIAGEKEKDAHLMRSYVQIERLPVTDVSQPKLGACDHTG